MKTRVPYYHKDFKCVGSKCTDTCCAGWEIIIDDETYKHYNNICGEFGERLKSNLTLYEDGVALPVMNYLIIKELNVVRWIDNNHSFDINDQIDIMHMYSKEIENSEKNLYDLEEMFNTNKRFDLKQLLI